MRGAKSNLPAGRVFLPIVIVKHVIIILKVIRLKPIGYKEDMVKIGVESRRNSGSRIRTNDTRIMIPPL